MDLRSDTLTRPTAGDARGDGRGGGRRRRLRRGPDGQRPGGAGRRTCSATRPRCSSRAARWATRSACAWSSRPAEELRLRRRRPRRDLRARRRRAARRHPEPHGARRPDDVATVAAVRCARPAGGPCATSAVSVEQTHNRGGGAVHPLAVLQGAARADRRARHGAALRRRPHLERLGRVRHAARGLRRAVRHAVGVPDQGPRRAGRLGRRHRRRAGRARRGCCASGSAAGCGRPACWRRPGAYALDHQLERLAEDHRRARADRRGARRRRRSTPTSCRSTCRTAPTARRRGRPRAGRAAVGGRAAPGAPGHPPRRRRRRRPARRRRRRPRCSADGRARVSRPRCCSPASTSATARASASSTKPATTSRPCEKAVDRSPPDAAVGRRRSR